jgi:hypothetical protein
MQEFIARENIRRFEGSWMHAAILSSVRPYLGFSTLKTSGLMMRWKREQATQRLTSGSPSGRERDFAVLAVCLIVEKECSKVRRRPDPTNYGRCHADGEAASVP